MSIATQGLQLWLGLMGAALVYYHLTRRLYKEAEEGEE